MKTFKLWLTEEEDAAQLTKDVVQAGLKGIENPNVLDPTADMKQKAITVAKKVAQTNNPKAMAQIANASKELKKDKII